MAYGFPDLNERLGFIRGVTVSILSIFVGFGAIHESNASIESLFSLDILLYISSGLLLSILFIYIGINDEVRDRTNKLHWQILWGLLILAVVLAILYTSVSTAPLFILLISFSFSNLLLLFYLF